MPMARYLLKRFLFTLPALWLVLTLVFLMIPIVPGDPVEQMLGEGAAPRQLAQLRHVLGLDLPLHTQYAHYLWQLGRGDLGQSFKLQSPVRQIVFERYPATLQLAFLALIVSAAIAIPAGNARRLSPRSNPRPRCRRVCSFRMIDDTG